MGSRRDDLLDWLESSEVEEIEREVLDHLDWLRTLKTRGYIEKMHYEISMQWCLMQVDEDTVFYCRKTVEELHEALPRLQQRLEEMRQYRQHKQSK